MPILLALLQLNTFVALARWATGLGCEQGQGYRWSRPLSADETEKWMLQDAAKPTPARAPAATTAVVNRPSPHPGADGDRRVLLVDDDRTYRQVLRLIIESEPGYRVVGEATDGREAIAVARDLGPDVILLDLAMPGRGGLKALPLLLDVVPAAEIVVLSSLEPAYIEERAGDRGATGFCTKLDAPATLFSALGHTVAA